MFIIKFYIWDFVDFEVIINAFLYGGRAICFDKCFIFVFSEDIVYVVKYIIGLEFYIVIVVVNFWVF